MPHKVAVFRPGFMGLGIARTPLRGGFETIGCDLRDEASMATSRLRA